MKMCDSDEGEFMCSQVTTRPVSESQSFDYGKDIIDDELEVLGNVVSLENQIEKEYDVGNGEEWISSREKIVLYDNVEIEDISSDEELDAL